MSARGSFEQHDFVEFFSSNRQDDRDLYPSERHFLPDLARGATTVLDVGCAAGGFAGIWLGHNGRLGYTGVDVSEALIEQARVRHPEHTFLVGDAAAGLQLADRQADIVAALGWLHWETRWQAALRELWRLTGKHLFFDVRLHGGGDIVEGVQLLPGGGETAYLCLPTAGLLALLESLEPASVRAHGYLRAPAATVRGMAAQVCMATFVIDREPGHSSSLDLPRECLD